MMKLLCKFNDYIRKPVWFLLFIVSFIYIWHINRSNDLSNICNWISFIASLFTIITAGFSVYAYHTVSYYKKGLLRKRACKENIEVLRKIISSVEDDFNSKRISNDYLECAKKYINDIAKDEKLLDAFGTNYQIIMQMERLNLSVKDSFINAVTAIINIYNESEKL